MQGEENGKQVSADQVVKLARTKLTTSEYIMPKQIKSLFSCWTKLRRLGQLKNEEEVESDDDNHAEIQQETVRITNEMTWSMNDWVVCKYNDKWYPGIVISIDHHVTIKCMDVPAFGKNGFKWPQHKDVSTYDPDDVVQDHTSIPVTSRFFGLSDQDFKDFNKRFLSHKSKY